ncbi:uncharacterized protein EAF01_007892 [Botrytis porri]|uniref:uncharacterized protein n=1 Tax=Botrytis porri TaxID=87229 RepID=UPI00190204A5|nr:uncharacterized protein EAF01_007892 [Botrytis porri]KAF7900590.1 hypothetical protein EAF01_007892 [Botrytis porri]
MYEQVRFCRISIGAHLTRLAINCRSLPIYKGSPNRITRIIIEPCRWKSLDLIGFRDTQDSHLEGSYGHGIMDYCKFFRSTGFNTIFEATDNVRRSTRVHQNGCLYCLRCMKPGDYYFTTNDFHEFESCRKRYTKADRDFEQQEGFPNLRFVEEIFTLGLPRNESCINTFLSIQANEFV